MNFFFFIYLEVLFYLPVKYDGVIMYWLGCLPRIRVSVYCLKSNQHYPLLQYKISAVYWKIIIPIHTHTPYI